MKPIILTAFLLLSFNCFSQDIDKGLARVNQKFGFYIFEDIKPVNEYIYLGEVNQPGMTWSGSSDETWNVIIKRVRKEFPDTEALILHSGQKKVECIKFKTKN